MDMRISQKLDLEMTDSGTPSTLIPNSNTIFLTKQSINYDKI
jgi:hypothetical protein